jgi:hypothetical protein
VIDLYRKFVKEIGFMLNENADAGAAQKIGTIDLTPTWGEVGLLFWRLALSGEIAAVEQMRSEIARAFAGMEVLSRLMSTLTPEQRAVFDEVWQAEQAKMLR